MSRKKIVTDELKRLWAEGQHPIAIAQHFGCTESAVYNTANLLGLKREVHRLDRSKVAEMWNQGATCRQIGDALGCSASHVSNVVRSMDLPRRRAGHLKLYLPGLQAMLDRGMTQREIAEHFDCGETTVHRHVLALNAARKRAEPPSAPARGKAPEPDTSTVIGRLIASRGRWSELESIRQAQGWTTVQVQQRYHAAMRAGA